MRVDVGVGCGAGLRFCCGVGACLGENDPRCHSQGGRPVLEGESLVEEEGCEEWGEDEFGLGEGEVLEEGEEGGADALGEGCGGVEEGWEGGFFVVCLEGCEEGLGLFCCVGDAEEGDGQFEEFGEEDACQWIEVLVLGCGLGLDFML